MRRKAPVNRRQFVAGSHRSLMALCSIGVMLGLGGCGQPDFEATSPAEVERVARAESAEPGIGDTLAVVGGDVTTACGVPMTVKIPGCTATLVAPTILLTAKHCGPKAGMQVQFGEKAPFAFTVAAVKCVSAPNSDAAYCVLPADERLRRVPTVPVLHGCEYTKFLKPGAKLLGVGFGQTRNTGPARTKIEVEVPVVRVRNPFIDVGDMTHDLCFGDSGGGAYIHLVEGEKDWGWRMVGTVTGTARVPGGAPCGGTNYTTVLRHIKMIEDNEDIDITPCTDEMGAWAPGPECTSILTDIQSGGGAWPACTYGAKTTLAIDSCGMGGGPMPVTPPPAPPNASPPDASAPPVGVGNPGGAGGAGGPVGPGGSPPPPPPPDPGAGSGGASGTPGTTSTPPPGAAPTAPPPPRRDPGPAPPALAPSAPVQGGLGCAIGAGAPPSASAAPLALLALAILGLLRRRPRN